MTAMNSGELEKDELIALAKKEGQKLINAIETQDIAVGNQAIKSMKAILDTAANSLNFESLWHTGPVEYSGREFCLTGNFQTGTKEECEKKIIEKGGTVSKSVKLQTDYLIVGGEKSDYWAHENYGRKVERALEIRHQKKLGKPYIVGEYDWLKTL